MEFLKKAGRAAILFTGALLASCEMVVEVPMPEHTPKLAIRYMLGNETPDSAFYTFLPGYQPFVSYSQAILNETELKGLNSATLEVSDARGNVVETLRNGQTGPGVIGNGYYQPVKGFTAVPGQTYTLKASAPGYETVTSKLTLPGLVNGLQASFALTETQPFGHKGKVTITLPDNGAEENYYVLYGVLLDNHYLAQPRDVFTEEKVNEDDADLDTEYEEIHFSNNRYDAMAFNDLSLNGKSVSFSRDVVLYVGDFNKAPKYLRIMLHSITKDTYRYLKSLESYNDNYGNPFAEPTRVIGNLENGYGYFGGYTSTYVDIPL